MKFFQRHRFLACSFLLSAPLLAMNSGNSTDEDCFCTGGTGQFGRGRSLTLVLPLTQVQGGGNDGNERPQSDRTKQRRGSPPRRELSTIISPRASNNTQVPLLELNGPQFGTFESPPLIRRCEFSESEKKEEDSEEETITQETESDRSAVSSNESRRRSLSGHLTPRSLRSILKKHSSKNKKEKNEAREVSFEDEVAEIERGLEIYPSLFAEMLHVEIRHVEVDDEPEVYIRIALYPFMESLMRYIDDEDIFDSELQDPRQMNIESAEDIMALYEALVAMLEWKVEKSYLTKGAKERLQFLKTLHALLAHFKEATQVNMITGMRIDAWVEHLRDLLNIKSYELRYSKRVRQIALGLYLEKFLKTNVEEPVKAFVFALDMLAGLLTTSLIEGYSGDLSESLLQFGLIHILETASHAESRNNTIESIFLNRIAIMFLGMGQSLDASQGSQESNLNLGEERTKGPLGRLFARK